MKQCRLSEFNQVIEVFEAGKYDEDQFDFLKHEIIECPEDVEPLMWYIGGEWLQEADYQIKPPSTPMTVDQLVDVLKYNGVEVWPL